MFNKPWSQSHNYSLVISVCAGTPLSAPIPAGGGFGVMEGDLGSATGGTWHRKSSVNLLAWLEQDLESSTFTDHLR